MALTLPQLPCKTNNNAESNLNDLIFEYFNKGFTYLEIKEFLSVHHSKEVSLSTIKRRLKSLNLYRRPLVGRRVDPDTLDSAVWSEICGSGSNIGHRRIWAHLKRKGILARREDIRIAVLSYDPEGVA